MQRVTKVDFLSAEALFPQGPFILVFLMKCPVYTVFCLKQQSKHVIYFDHFIILLAIASQTQSITLLIPIYTPYNVQKLCTYLEQT